MEVSIGGLPARAVSAVGSTRHGDLEGWLDCGREYAAGRVDRWESNETDSFVNIFLQKNFATVRALFSAKNWQEGLSDRLLIGIVLLSCDAIVFRVLRCSTGERLSDR